MYVIDRLATESAETLRDIKPGSYEINNEGDICYESNSLKRMVNSVSRKTSQAGAPPVLSDCKQAVGDALSVNAVKTRSGSTAEDSQNETGSESDDSEQCNYTSRVRTQLRIQNDADAVKDIADLGWNKRQKLKLRHIADHKMGRFRS